MSVLRAVAVTATGASAYIAYAALADSTHPSWQQVVIPAMRLLDAERAHHVAVGLASFGLSPADPLIDAEERGDTSLAVLRTAVWGLEFANPVGLAAGFDKGAECVPALLSMGFGFVEVGSVTPEPQPGNPLPRMWRIPERGAVVNRYGFNSDGQEVVAGRLQALRDGPPLRGVLGVNLGKNKYTPEVDAALDFQKGAKRLHSFGDYMVVNVSSPNTPGLRALQGREILKGLLGAVQVSLREVAGAAGPPPLLVKITCDMTRAELADIAAVVLQLGVDGVIVSNTTVERPGFDMSIEGPHKEAGGMSGEPLREMATESVRSMYELTKGKVPIVGVGGVGSGADALEKIKAGASLVQIYSSMTLQGPGVVSRIKSELAVLLRDEGYACVTDAVGASAQRS